MTEINLSYAIPFNTPWGQFEDITEYADGIFYLTTPSHGGFWLSPERNALVPDYFKTEGKGANLRKHGWYEHDCDWAIAALVFEPEFRGYWTHHPRFNGQDLPDADEQIMHARRILVACQADAFARFMRENPPHTVLALHPCEHWDGNMRSSTFLGCYQAETWQDAVTKCRRELIAYHQGEHKPEDFEILMVIAGDHTDAYVPEQDPLSATEQAA